jgi:hypothetical protein
MCFVCGDPGQIQQEARLAVHLVQIVAGVPIFAIVAWQLRDLWKTVGELIDGLRKRKQNKAEKK